MNTKHPKNRNLNQFTGNDFLGLPLLLKHQPYIREYLEIISEVFRKALQEYPRSQVIRFDLRIPEHFTGDLFSNGLMTRFVKSMREIIEADLIRKGRMNTRTHNCYMRFVWVREIDKSRKPHFHVAIFLNRDAYRNVGKYGAIDENMANRINRAWASALGMQTMWYDGLVYFPKNCSYSINYKKTNPTQEEHDAFMVSLRECFRRVAYLAKADTKAFGYPGRNIGYSQK
ncbi:inovirus Gp2 family protein [Litoribrevibacter albus]|uniref:DUF3296 domain-containing protein n=1 Tax=Litoribrevibacter albus TaxID=1473156 RepID=A0AA37SFC7_9GAMM|nr:inovirus Gp2 family protein [Litoribrevibacter albus]GLQ33004.1 DUF3296 domain-containing protein [Litoribrevibacter albus]